MHGRRVLSLLCGVWYNALEYDQKLCEHYVVTLHLNEDKVLMLMSMEIQITSKIVSVKMPVDL